VSIIHRALERQRQQSGGPSPGRPGSGGEPSSAPNPPVSPKLLGLMVVVLIGGGMFWAWQFGWIGGARRGSRPPAARPQANVTARPVPRPATTTVAHPPPTPTGPTTLIERVDTPTNVPVAQSQGVRTGEVSAAASSPSGTGVTNAPTVTSSSSPLQTATQGTTGQVGTATEASTAAGIQWPILRVQGVVCGSAPDSGTVILDRGTYDVGQTTADGVKILRVEEEAVWFEYQGNQRRVRLGASTGP
jgi:hypothetical protein